MTIAILGGSFDPPHNGHLTVARKVLKSNKIQKIMLMPTGIHPFDKTLTSARHRLAMTRLLEEKNIEASDFEIKKNSISYSIETLRRLKKQFPKNHFYWIIGSDQLNDLPKWKDWQSIVNDFGFIVVSRDNPISSSEIRQRIKEGKPITNLVPKSIERYIIQNKLYT